MHMTCALPCKFEFCGVLVYGSLIERELVDFIPAIAMRGPRRKERLRKGETMKNFLERYMYYYECWASNQLLRQKDIADTHSMEREKDCELIEIIREPQTQLRFIIDAWEHVFS